MPDLKRVLLVEDSARDAELILNALSGSPGLDVVHVWDGAEALDYLHQRGPFVARSGGIPALILLDLKLPKVDGLEVLRLVKSDGGLRHIPVVMMTSSRQEQDLIKSYELGVNAYVVKPIKFQDFIDAVERVSGFWAVTNELPPSSSQRPGEPANRV